MNRIDLEQRVLSKTLNHSSTVYIRIFKILYIIVLQTFMKSCVLPARRPIFRHWLQGYELPGKSSVFLQLSTYTDHCNSHLFDRAENTLSVMKIQIVRCLKLLISTKANMRYYRLYALIVRYRMSQLEKGNSIIYIFPQKFVQVL